MKDLGDVFYIITFLSPPCHKKEKVTRRKTLETFLVDLEKQDGLITDFDSILWYNLVDFVTVHAKDNVWFTFKNGTVIQV